jgi:hypothetical protein
MESEPEDAVTVIRKIVRVGLIVLTLFLAATALAGGFALVAGINVPSSEQLTRSVFGGPTLPGIALFVVVGGSALLAAILLIRNSRFAALAGTAAGITIMFFEFVEVLVIGSPPGVAQALQIFYFGLGTIMVTLGIAWWFIDLRMN